MCVPQPPSTVPSGMHLVAKRSLSRSASSAPTFNPIRTTCHFCASLKAEARNDDSDVLDDGIAIYAIGVPIHSLAYGRMIGEQQEMYDQQGVAWTTDTMRIQKKVFWHRWIPGTGGRTLHTKTELEKHHNDSCLSFRSSNLESSVP
jgi:hypothetical protein